MHAKAYDPTIELRSDEQGQRFLYSLRNNSIYTVSLNSLDDREDQNYVGDKGTTKPTGVHLKKTETRIYERAEKGGREPPNIK